MSLEKNVMEQLKIAMKSKDQVALASLRAIKTAILKAKTEEGAQGKLSEEDELKLLQREVKQRKEAAEQFIAQEAREMAEEELAQAKSNRAIFAQTIIKGRNNDCFKRNYHSSWCRNPS